MAAEAYNTHRASASAWERFQTWANADDHPALPSTPQAVALYLGHLAAAGRSMASIAQAHVAISHFHAAAGMQKGDNPARHPVVAEAVNGVREVLPFPRRGRVESPETAHKRAALDLAIIGVLADTGDGGHSARHDLPSVSRGNAATCLNT